MVRCCRECTERHTACHDACERYLKEKAEAKKEKEWMKKQDNPIGVWSYNAELWETSKRKRKGKK